MDVVENAALVRIVVASVLVVRIVVKLKYIQVYYIMRSILALLTLHFVLPFYSQFKIQRTTYLTALRKPLQKNYDDMDVFERFEKN